MINQSKCRIVENVQIAERTFRIRFEAPQIAIAIRPGQFIMLRIPDTSDPLLGRPFALYDTVLDSAGTPLFIDVVYLVVGKMTQALSHRSEGESIIAWGPLGNGFPLFDHRTHVVFVAGGIGQTPFLAYARELLGGRGYGNHSKSKRAERVSLYYGVRNESFAAGIEDFTQAGCETKLASDDGSIGFAGFVTQLLERDHPNATFIGCGPEPMLEALNRLTSRWNAETYVSLETPMACGFGACFSCVTKVKTTTGWDYKRVCVDGPVFESCKLEWGH